MDMKANGLMEIVPQAPFYFLVVNFGRVKINMTKGMIIASAERLSDPVLRSLETDEEGTLDIMEPDIMLL